MPDTPSPHLLIFEPDPRGHAREWIEHLINEADSNPTIAALTVMVERDLSASLAAAYRGRLEDRLRFLPLTKREYRSCSHSNLVISAFGRWWAMRRGLRESFATHCLYLGIDHLSLPLALGLGANGRPITGILFRPSVHYAELGPYAPRFQERLRDYRKDILYRGMLANRSVHAVLSLDPFFPSYAKRRYGKGTKVSYLPDPACPAVEPEAGDRRLADSLPAERTAFVLFGELTERKGVIPLLQALGQLNPEVAAKTAVMIAGRVDPPLRPALKEAFADMSRRQPDLAVHLEDRRLSMGEITALVRRSDVVLVPYQKFVGSSGLLLWAAREGRPVICQDYGLLGRLTRDNGLGLSVDTTAPTTLAHAIEAAVQRGADALGVPALRAAFAGAQRADDFARIVLRQALAGRVAPAARGSTAWW